MATDPIKKLSNAAYSRDFKEFQLYRKLDSALVIKIIKDKRE